MPCVAHVALAAREVLAHMRGLMFCRLDRFVRCRALAEIGLEVGLDGIGRLAGLGGRRRAGRARRLRAESRTGDQTCRNQRGGEFRQHCVLLVVRRR